MTIINKKQTKKKPWTNPWKCVLTLFRMGLLGAAHGWWGKKPPLPKICHIYPTIMNFATVIPSLKKIQKHINHVTYPLSSADISNFSPEISNFLCIKKYTYRLHFNTQFLNLLTFFRVFKGYFNKHGCNFDDVSSIGYSRPS